MTPDEIARMLTPGATRALLAMAGHPPREWLTYKAGGFTASGADILYVWSLLNPLCERKWVSKAYRYRATDLGRTVAILTAGDPDHG